MCAAARVADVGESAAMESEPKKKLDDLIHLAELCIDVLQQNEEFHAEVGASVTAARCRAPPPLPRAGSALVCRGQRVYSYHALTICPASFLS